MYEIPKALNILAIIVAILLLVFSILALLHAVLSIFIPLIAISSFGLSIAFFFGFIWWGMTFFLSSRRSKLGYFMYVTGTLSLLFLFPIGTLVGILILLILIFSKDVKKWYRI